MGEAYYAGLTALVYLNANDVSTLRWERNVFGRTGANLRSSVAFYQIICGDGGKAACFLPRALTLLLGGHWPSSTRLFPLEILWPFCGGRIERLRFSTGSHPLIFGSLLISTA